MLSSQTSLETPLSNSASSQNNSRRRKSERERGRGSGEEGKKEHGMEWEVGRGGVVQVKVEGGGGSEEVSVDGM